MDLQAILDELSTCKYLMVDTEFVRESTYWPILSLVQLGGNGQFYVIDATSKHIDLNIVKAFLDKPEITKVFHSARQDIEIFYHLFGAIPAPLFDTQNAACYLGYRDNIGFGELVQKLTQVELDKSLQHTNWLIRPLSAAQIEYALQDVVYLDQIFQIMHDQLVKLNRLDWVIEDFVNLYPETLLNPDPLVQWRKITIKNGRPKNLNIARAVARWRELTSQELNISKSKLLKDDIIKTIATCPNLDNQSFKQILNQTKNLVFKLNLDPSLWNDIELAINCPPETWPSHDKYAPPSTVQENLSKKIYLIIETVAEELQLQTRIICSKKEVDAITADLLATDLIDKNELLKKFNLFQGWRLDHVGVQILDMLKKDKIT